MWHSSYSDICEPPTDFQVLYSIHSSYYLVLNQLHYKSFHLPYLLLLSLFYPTNCSHYHHFYCDSPPSDICNGFIVCLQCFLSTIPFHPKFSLTCREEGRGGERKWRGLSTHSAARSPYVFILLTFRAGLCDAIIISVFYGGR